jgi:hypothetical protein
MNQQQREQLRRIAHLLDDWLYRFSTGEAKSAATLLRSLAEEPHAAGPEDVKVYQAIADNCTHPVAKQERLTDEQIDDLLLQSAGLGKRALIDNTQSACAKAWGVKL